MGVVTWNEEAGGESSSSSNLANVPRVTAKYYLQLHLANRVSAAELPALQALVIDPSPAARQAVAARIRRMQTLTHPEALGPIATLYESAASTDWGTRASFDRNGGDNFFQLKLKREIPPAYFAAVSAYLHDRQDAAGRAYLLQIFASDAGARAILEL